MFFLQNFWVVEFLPFVINAIVPCWPLKWYLNSKEFAPSTRPRRFKGMNSLAFTSLLPSSTWINISSTYDFDTNSRLILMITKYAQANPHVLHHILTLTSTRQQYLLLLLLESQDQFHIILCKWNHTCYVKPGYWYQLATQPSQPRCATSMCLNFLAVTKSFEKRIYGKQPKPARITIVLKMK